MTHRLTLRAAIFSLVVASVSVSGQETVNLTTPEPSNTNYHVQAVMLNVDDGVLTIHLLGANGSTLSCSYTPSTTPTGATLITGLNKAALNTAYAGNATTGSLKQRIFHRLVVMGEATAVCGRPIAGTLTGTVP